MSFHASIVALKDFSPKRAAELFPEWRVTDTETDFFSAIRYDFGALFAIGSVSEWTILAGRDLGNVPEATARKLLQYADGGWYYLCGVASIYALLIVSDGVPIRQWFRDQSSERVFGFDSRPLGFSEDFVFSQLKKLAHLSHSDLAAISFRCVESTVA